ncbi:NAD(P)-binding protein, partial [Cadophora sp. DSE1049]
YPIEEAELAELAGKTAIVTGGASGIGRATVLLAHAAGANVAVADLKASDGKELEAQLQERIFFVQTDVTVWASVLALFESTVSRFGGVDAVFANAGGAFPDALLENEVDEAGTLRAPSMKSIEVNLYGAVYTSKAAIHYFEKDPDRQHQLVLTGSAASFLDTPLFLYGALKAGILGLMRGLRSTMRGKDITVNMIVPWMTVTAQVPDWLKKIWGDFPANDPEGVAKALVLPLLRLELNGRTIWVAGNKAVELEQALDDTRPQWMGEKLSAAVQEGQKRMSVGESM